MDSDNLPVNTSPAPAAATATGRARQVIGYLLAAACLVWVFHDIHLPTFLASLTTINWWWVAPAILFDILSYFCQGLRWRLLLRPLGRLSALRSTQAIYVGLFANEVLPMRFGELVRAYLVSRWLSTEFVSVVPSMAVERLFDGVWLAVAIGLTAIFIPLPKELLEAGDVLGALVLLATGAFVFILLRKKPAPGGETSAASGWKPLRRLRSLVGGMASGLQRIGLSRASLLAFGLSLGLLVLQGAAFWLVLWAYGLRLSFWVGFAVFAIVHLGTAVPNAPSNVGTYQFFCVVGLTLFGVEKTLATGFSVVVFILLTIPLWILGAAALSRSGTTFYALRSEINKLLLRQGRMEAS